MAACHPRRREASAAPILGRIFDIESAAAWWWRRRRGGGSGGIEAANDFFLVFKNFCEKFTVTNALEGPRAQTACLGSDRRSKGQFWY